MIPFLKTETAARVRLSDYDFPTSVAPHIPVLTRATTYRAAVQGVKLEINFFTPGENCDAYAQAAGEVLAALLPYDRCPKGRAIKADVFLSDCPKQMPEGPVFGRNHMNTGYAERCSAAPFVVFRKEEWLKVFIHECFHYLNLDADVADARLPMFGIPTVVKVSEAFCEVWARILNCYLVAARTGKSARRLLAQERRYAVRNMVRVLAHMGLTFADLRTPKAAGYREGTSTFAYVVLSAILMTDPAEFERVFAGFRGNTAQVLALVEKQMVSPTFLKEVNKPLRKTSRMRMSAIKLF